MNKITQNRVAIADDYFLSRVGREPTRTYEDYQLGSIDFFMLFFLYLEKNVYIVLF